MGKCSQCGSFGTFVEVHEPASVAARAVRSASAVQVMSLSDAGRDEAPRIPIGIPELDQVLGGGLVYGSLTLLGGEPGIGKSTVLLQAAESLARAGHEILYVCGEESPRQIGLRATRLGATSDAVALLPEPDIVTVEAVVHDRKPSVLIVDSVQTAVDPEANGAAGSVTQVRAVTARLVRIAKELGVTTLLVGHVTKEGAIAGPRVLEHMVDTVLYFEGDRDHAFRIVRSVKNRFGSVSEIGIFEMTESGLVGVDSPSAALLAERVAPVAGSVVLATMEGTRPLLVEVQALVTRSYLPSPRRFATGIELSRLHQVLGVLERRGGLNFSDRDVYVSITGGLKVTEPALDLPLALALASALRDRPLPLDLVAFGELGLTGAVRAAPHAQTRVREATSRGFAEVVASSGGRTEVSGIRHVGSIADALVQAGIS